MDRILFSSVKNNKNSQDNWITPPEIMEYLNDHYNFTCDLAADKNNAVCSKFFSEEDDALSKEWSGVNFLNPPYSIWPKFALKATQELERSRRDGEEMHIVLLIPSRTDTKAFHSLLPWTKLLIFIQGRLKFGGPSNNSAPFPSCILNLSSSATSRCGYFQKIYALIKKNGKYREVDYQ